MPAATKPRASRRPKPCAYYSDGKRLLYVLDAAYEQLVVEDCADLSIGFMDVAEFIRQKFKLVRR